METLRSLLAAESSLIKATFSAGSPYGAPSLLGALIVAAAYYIWRRRSRGRPASMKGFVRSIFAPRIVLHRSSLVDMKMWVLNGLVLMLAYGTLAVGGLTCRDLTIGALTRVFGPHEPTAWPLWLVMALATLFELLAYEFAYWFGHYLFHRFPALWEFHKVHHSAEVMTTLTELRQHPVEILAFMNLIGIATGSVFGAMTYAFGPGAHHFTLLNANIALMIFLLTWGHLRHSHIWISFTGVAGILFQSPAHHQLHHSDNPEHFNKNLGFMLAIWDWVFGTLQIPEKAPQNIRFGVGEEHADYDTVTNSFVRPFIRFAEHFAPPPHDAPVQDTPRPQG